MAGESGAGGEASGAGTGAKEARLAGTLRGWSIGDRVWRLSIPWRPRGVEATPAVRTSSDESRGAGGPCSRGERLPHDRRDPERPKPEVYSATGDVSPPAGDREGRSRRPKPEAEAGGLLSRWGPGGPRANSFWHDGHLRSQNSGLDEPSRKELPTRAVYQALKGVSLAIEHQVPGHRLHIPPAAIFAEQELPRRSPWEGLAPGSPASAGGRSRAPSGDRGPWRSERSATRAARPPAADGRRPAVSCREGRDGSWDTCEVGSCGSSSPPDLGSSQSIHPQPGLSLPCPPPASPSAPNSSSPALFPVTSQPWGTGLPSSTLLCLADPHPRLWLQPSKALPWSAGGLLSPHGWV
ncbi:uncharacterized protein LOC122702014 [Cervus elaphus]|uniref:uncharacterized protein LOC122702014 n=1 Tax=Cervus elaphus TaxID=9860 RepID=UPI001CC2EFF4|nr:uncharacterized protein LOC122702014 [Cervus elaphus]